MSSRDLDSPLLSRERAAVDEWLSSNKSFHTMRDHPFHNIIIMGGLWSYRPQLNLTLTRLLRSKFENTTLMWKYDGMADQWFLNIEVWPLVKNHLLSHDSFHCGKIDLNTRPFPTQRPPKNNLSLFVGCVKPCTPDRYPFGPCPVNCRPAAHKDWTYCWSYAKAMVILSTKDHMKKKI